MNNKMIYHYNNFIDAQSNEDVVAYDHAWLFIRILLEEAFKIDLTSNENRNVDIINGCINDEELRAKIHKIRLARNDYQHGDTLELNKYIYIYELKPIVGKTIEYVHENSEYRFKQEEDDYTYHHGNQNDYHKRIKFKNDPIAEKNKIANDVISITQQSILKKYDVKEYDTYPIAYGDSSKFFAIKSSNNCKSEHPVFSVIHNILVRSATISESSYLRSKLLLNSLLADVYIYEILMLRVSYKSEINYLHVAPSKIEAAKYALGDIEYYQNIFKNICSENKIQIMLVEDDAVAEYSVACEKEELFAKLLDDDTDDVFTPAQLSERIHYFVNKSNVFYYQLLLKELFGFERFRDGQIATLKAILETDDSNLVVLPTGYGKSLIYQFITFLQPLVSIVISPTDILIYDQIENLKDYGVTRVNVMSSEDITIQKLYKHNYLHYQISSILNYVLPREVESEEVFNLISRLHDDCLINCISIDECHQISIWGHKFEAEYFALLHQLKDEMLGEKFLLFSATSSTRIKEDLCTQFEPNVIKTIQPCPLKRNNIKYRFYVQNDTDEIANHIASYFKVNFKKGSTFDVSNLFDIPSLTLIICNSKVILEKIKSAIEQDPTLCPYCAIFDGQKSVYKQFRLGKKRILLTNDEYLAGINIPFLRNVIVVGYPPSKEWFYQETGRVGRSGEESNVIVYTVNDKASVNNVLNSNGDIALGNIDMENDINIANMEFFYSLNFSTKHIEEANSTYLDITKCVHASVGAKVGRVEGTMDKAEKNYYDFPLFLLYYVQIIIKWLYFESASGDDLTYKYYINLEIDDGVLWFKNNLLNLVADQSGNGKIKKKYIAKVKEISSFFDLFETLALWLNENGFYIRQQMFLNTYQLVEEGQKNSNEAVENSLTSYFGYGSDPFVFVNQIGDIASNLARFCEAISNCVNCLSLEEERESKKQITSKFDVAQQQKVEQQEMKERKERIKELIKNEVKPKPRFTVKRIEKSQPVNEIATTLVEDTPVLTDESQNSSEPKENVVDKSNFEIVDNTTQVNASSDFSSPIVYDFSGFINSLKAIESVDISVDETLKVTETCSDEMVISLRAILERQLEYKYSQSYEIALSVIELKYNEYFPSIRISKVLKNLGSEIFKAMLMKIGECVSTKRKVKIDNYMISENVGPVYYMGVKGKLIRFIFNLFFGSETKM